MKRLSIRIITPAPPRSKHGNRATALRWARILRELGHRVVIQQQYGGAACDLLIGLHARRSGPSIARFHKQFPERPLIVALAGTDVYQDLPKANATALRSVELATRLVVLQPLAVKAVPKKHRGKARVIYQSVQPPAHRTPPRDEVFEVCVVAHLRAVKDPFRAAHAVRHLPLDSNIQVLGLGGALSDSMRRRAEEETKRNPRYRWLGDLSRSKTLQLMSRCRLMVISSKSEGGSNVLSEALAIGLPVVATRVDGNVGMLGRNYAGYFDVGDTRQLRELLLRAEREDAFYQKLAKGCQRAAAIVDPARERAAWSTLLDELV